MAITTYAELKTAVANWLKRSDLTAVIPDFITLAEVKMYRGEMTPSGVKVPGLRLSKMEASTTEDTVSGTERYDLPSDFLEMRNISYSRSSYTRDLAYRTPRQLDKHNSDESTGYPQKFTIEGNQFRLRPIPSSVWTLSILYFQKLSALSDSVSTNDILTDYPDIYLFGALEQAENYLKNDNRAALWGAKMLSAISAANAVDRGGRTKGGARQAVASVGAYRARNI